MLRKRVGFKKWFNAFGVNFEILCDYPCCMLHKWSSSYLLVTVYSLKFFFFCNIIIKVFMKWSYPCTRDFFIIVLENVTSMNCLAIISWSIWPVQEYDVEDSILPLQPALNYTAPELVRSRGSPAGSASDIFSFGCLAYHLIAHKPLFDCHNNVKMVLFALTFDMFSQALKYLQLQFILKLFTFMLQFVKRLSNF